ncbi:MULTISPECIES: hypothetical protein [Bacillus]|nr:MULTISPECIES: hypothetical protein [Bacillus]MBS4749336.1 hypothetical protein [Bacillus altitudinis]
MLAIKCEGIFRRSKKSIEHLNVNENLVKIYYENSDLKLKSDKSEKDYKNLINRTFASSKLFFIKSLLELGEVLAFDDNDYEYYIFESITPNTEAFKKLDIIIFCKDKDVIKCINSIRKNIRNIIGDKLGFEIKKESNCCVYPVDDSGKVNFDYEKILKINVTLKNRIEQLDKWLLAIFTGLFLISLLAVFLITNSVLQTIVINLCTSFGFYVLAEIIVGILKYKWDSEIIYFRDLPNIMDFYYNSMQKEKNIIDEIEEERTPLERDGEGENLSGAVPLEREEELEASTLERC